MNSGLEIKVGIFVVATTFIIAVMGIIFGKVDLSSNKGYEVLFEISDASGINKDVPVFYRGVRVGVMNSVMLDGENLIASMFIDNKYQIPDNVVFTIKQRGFIGENYVELVRNNSIPAAGFLESGKIYVSNQNLVSMDEVMAKVDKAADELTTLIKSLNDVFAKEESKTALKETIQSLKNISADIENIVATNEKKFNDIIDNTRSLTEAIDKLVQRNEENFDISMENVKELTASLKNFSASVDELVEKNKENIDTSLANLEDITTKLNVAMDDVSAIAKDINEGTGTIGMLINDNETKQEVKEVVTNLKDMVTRVSDWNLDVTFGADYLFDSGISDNARGYVNLRLHTKPETYYLVGVTNTPRSNVTRTTTNYTLNTSQGNAGILPDGTVAFKSIKDENKSSKLAFNIQYGHIFEEIIGMRVGIFESTLGGAIDIFPLKDDNLSLSFEMYDFNSYNDGFEAYTRAYIRWHFFRNFFVQAGIEDVLNNNNRVFTLGGGIRFIDNDLKYIAGSAASAVQ